jgi:arylsulfatase A-like enzyme
LTRQEPFTLAKPGSKYFLFIQGATHGSYAGKAAVAGRRAFSEFYSFGFSERMVRTPRWKYIHSDGFAPQLYNEHRDPQEVTNLAGELAYAAICRELEAAVCDGWARPDPQLIARP